MAELRFLSSDIERELEAVRNMARPFLERDSDRAFQDLRTQLENIKRKPDIQSRWEIPLRSPLRTIPSEGDYERSGQGAHSVVGRLTFVWEITARGRHPKVLDLTGNASTRVELIDVNCEPPLEFAMWRMEIGDEHSPGYCFHAQALGQRAEPPFPKSLPIPRLPIFPATPMAALEFLLSELFQTAWAREASKRTANTNLWAAVQAQRWKALLDWQHGQVARASGSPWVSLKQFPGNIFLPDKHAAAVQR